MHFCTKSSTGTTATASASMSCPFPFRCVSTDLNTLHKVIFYGGSIPLAVRASIAIPGIFAPVKYRGHYLVDGAIMENLPTEVAKNDLRSDVVIAVLLPSTEFTDSDVASIVGVFARAFSAGTARNERESMKLANVLLTPDTGKYGVGDYSKAKELIDAGYEAAKAQRDKPAEISALAGGMEGVSGGQARPATERIRVCWRR